MEHMYIYIQLDEDTAKLFINHQFSSTYMNTIYHLTNMFIPAMFFFLSDIPIHLFKKPTKEYTDEQRKFATTLFFYSPKAYKFLSKTFHLPSPSTIRR